MGIEYSKARQSALRRAYPDSFYGAGGLEGEDEEFDFGMERMMPQSVPASPRFRMSGIATPGDIGTLTEEVNEVLFCCGKGVDHLSLVDASVGYE